MVTGKRQGVRTEKGDEGTGNDGYRSINAVGSTAPKSWGLKSWRNFQPCLAERLYILSKGAY